MRSGGLYGAEVADKVASRLEGPGKVALSDGLVRLAFPFLPFLTPEPGLVAPVLVTFNIGVRHNGGVLRVGTFSACGRL